MPLLLHVALMKSALESPPELMLPGALFGGAAGGLTGGAIGAIGAGSALRDEPDPAKRRKALIRSTLLGALSGAVPGSLLGGVVGNEISAWSSPEVTFGADGKMILNKRSAFKMNPFSTGQMAGYGGLAGGALGAGVGALTGLYGTESGSPERRKAMLRRGLIGLLAGGGLGAATGGLASSSARGNFMDQYDTLATQNSWANPLKHRIVNQLVQQRDKEPLERLATNPEMLDIPVAQKMHDRMEQGLKETKMSPMSTLRILVGDDPLHMQNGMSKELQDGMSRTPTGLEDARNPDNAAWDVIKRLGLTPKN